MFYFVKPAEARVRPQLEDYAEDGGYDYYGYDMAVEQWRSQFPDLSEYWCGVHTERAPAKEPTLEEILQEALFG